MGPKLMNCCRPEQVSTKDFHGKMLRRRFSKTAVVPAKRQNIENWKKGAIFEKSIRGISLKWKVSWRKKDCGI